MSSGAALSETGVFSDNGGGKHSIDLLGGDSGVPQATNTENHTVPVSHPEPMNPSGWMRHQSLMEITNKGLCTPSVNLVLVSPQLTKPGIPAGARGIFESRGWGSGRAKKESVSL